MVVESPSNLRMIVGFESMLNEFSSYGGVILMLLYGCCSSGVSFSMPTCLKLRSASRSCLNP